MSYLRCLSLALLLVLVVPDAVARGGGPENVLLLVNVDSPESLLIANHYVQLRGIPDSNVLHLDGIPADTVVWQMEPFQQRVLKPVVQAIQERQLGLQIDYVVYSAGFPTAVESGAHVQRLKARTKQFNPRVFAARGSINALTYFYPEVLANNPSYMTLDANWYMRRTVPDFLKRPFFGESQKKFVQAVADLEGGDPAAAARQLATLVQQNPGQVVARYYLVRALAADGKIDNALQQLQRCIRTGWCYGEYTRHDESLAALKQDPRFEELLEPVPGLLPGDLPTRGFNNRIVWSANGWANRQSGQGKRFALSTVLAVIKKAGTRGSTVDEALRYLQRSVAADGTHPRGTFYFARTPDIRTRTRKPAFAPVITRLKKLGFDARQISEDAPRARGDVLGATLGKAQIDWPATGSRFVAGAICDNLTSFGGVMQASGQTPLTHYLAHGAAGASGTVIEPLAIAQKFPSPLIHLHYARGCTLAEAFYQSVASPFQLLIVGDPLCRPWATLPGFTVSGLAGGQVVTGDLELNLTPAADSVAISRFEIFLDGRLRAAVPAGKPLRISAEELPDGYHEMRVVAVDNTLIGTKSSQRIDFQVNRTGKSLSLTLPSGSPRTFQLARTVLVQATANCGTRIDVWHHLRKLGSIKGRSGELRIDCRDLGGGPVTLHATVEETGETIRSQPLAMEITP